MHTLVSILLCLIFINLSSALPIICYYKFNDPPIIRVPTDLCTHIILIGSAGISEEGQLIISENHIKHFATLKTIRNDIKLLLCITSPNPTFTYLTSSQQLMNQFGNDTTQLLNRYQLDGIDIDWEFPVWSQDAKKGDKQQFALFLEILNNHLHSSSKLLSIAVSGPPTITKVAYDVDAITKYVDMVQVMNYDFHIFNRFKNPFVGFNAPLHPMRFEISVLGQMNSEKSMETWFDMGLPRNITYFGIPTYARSFQLLTTYLHKPYSPAIRARNDLINYNDICPFIRLDYYKKVWNHNAQSPYLYGNDGLWVSYEDNRSILAKTAFARKIGVAGVMVFSIGSDDSKDECGQGKYPLLSEIHRLVNKY